MKENQIRSELNIMHKIYKDISQKNIEYNQAKLDQRINNIINKIKFNENYKNKINIIKGVYNLLFSLGINKENDKIYEKLELLKTLLDKDIKTLLDKEIKTSLKDVDDFFENNKHIKEENAVVKL